MNRRCCLSGILICLSLIFTNCSSLTLNIKDNPPSNKQLTNQQAVLAAPKNIPESKSGKFFLFVQRWKRQILVLLGLLWLWLLARFYVIEKRRRIPEWQLDDLALLKIIKDNASSLWHRLQEKPKAKIIPFQRRG